MRGRGMAVVLVPDFCSELVQGLSWNISVVFLEPINPDHEFVTLVLRKGQDAILQFSYAHRRVSMPRPGFDFKPGLARNRRRPRSWFSFHHVIGAKWPSILAQQDWN